jgi:CHRD domain-containing protein
MKNSIPLLLMATLSSQAALIHFDLSPPGTDVAVGLSPSNQVPVVTNSTGSGNTISAGIILDTDTSILQVAIGYGSAAGFTDLTGVPIGMHIHSAAPAGQNAGVFIDLSPYHFPAANLTNGGVIYGNISFPADGISNLLAGLDYVNIHTTLNQGGEIRGQLIAAVATNSPPSVSCPATETVECGTTAEVTIAVSDPEGDALTVTWALNGTPVQTNTLPASAPAVAANISFSALLPLGTNIIDVTVTDTATNTASCSAMVVVVDTTPSVIVSANANPNSLWPPNHKFVDVRISAQVTDTCSSTTWKIIKVKSNEPVNGLGDGDTGPDWQITGDHSLKLRAERSGKGSGRTYTVTIQAADTSGNLSKTKDVTVTVPHNQGKKN